LITIHMTTPRVRGVHSSAALLTTVVAEAQIDIGDSTSGLAL